METETGQQRGRERDSMREEYAKTKQSVSVEQSQR